MYAEDELLPISGLQHLSFCERRWALVHIEGQWEDNRFTAEGKLVHERAHSGEVGSLAGVLVRRTIPVRSFELGLVGQTDVVEFHRVDSGGVRIAGQSGQWRPFPIEYKRSRDKVGNAYRIQLCAQALSLEEMMGTTVPEGAVYDSLQRRRHAVAFSPDLRAEVAALAQRMHELHGLRKTPPPRYEKKCDSCSLLPVCLPRALCERSAIEYVAREAADAGKSGGL